MNQATQKLPWTIDPFPQTKRPPLISKFLPIVSHKHVGDRYAELIMYAPEIAQNFLPGQFLMISPAQRGERTPTLPRPMAIFDADKENDTISVVYGIVGAGTKKLSEAVPGSELMVVGPLGKSFNVYNSSKHLLLIGRGIGTCSIAPLTVYSEKGIEISVLNSARIPQALIGKELFERYHVKNLWEVTDSSQNSDVATVKNLLESDLQANLPDQIFVCGSTRLTSLAYELGQVWNIPVQVSLEAHMACGIGYCHGCASGIVGETEESPLVCVDGPVFKIESSLI